MYCKRVRPTRCTYYMGCLFSSSAYTITSVLAAVQDKGLWNNPTSMPSFAFLLVVYLGICDAPDVGDHRAATCRPFSPCTGSRLAASEASSHPGGTALVLVIAKKRSLANTFWGLATYTMQLLLLFPNVNLPELVASVSRLNSKHSSPLTFRNSTFTKERLA